MWRRATAAAAVALTGFAVTPAVHAANVNTVGQVYNDGLDARHSASRLADAANALGYGGAAYTAGRQVDAAWNDGLNSAVIGYFGHANAGVFQLTDAAADSDDQFMIAGTIETALPIYRNIRSWTEYLPYADVDDVRLAVLAGCYTADSDPFSGSFLQVGASRGMDAVVGWSGLVYYPARCTSCVYSGNYYWERASYYLRVGETLSVALSRARTDLVAKEGSAHGWNLYRVTGSVASPGGVRLKPAGDGQPLTSQPTGIVAYQLGALTVTGQSTGDTGLTEITTAEGVLLRRDATGRVADVWAPASVEGGVPMAVTDAAALGRTWTRTVTDVTAAHWQESGPTEVSHADGDALVAMSWTTREGHGVPERIDVEIDRRTGAVTYFAWTRGQSAGERVLSAEQAEQVALRAADAGSEVVSVEPRTWNGAQWIVTTTRESGPLGPRRTQFVVDAADGDLLAIQST